MTVLARNFTLLAGALSLLILLPVAQAQTPISPSVEESSEEQVNCNGGKTRICVFIPSGAEIVHVEYLMRNASWKGGGYRCRSDLGSTSFADCTPGGECGIGHSRIFNVDQSSGQVCATFYNWKHDNHRFGKIRVHYRE